MTATHIVNLSEADPGWNWLAGRSPAGRSLRWQSMTTRSVELPGRLDSLQAAKRWVASRRATALMTERSSVLVSHGPHMTLYGSASLASQLRRRRHLAYAFNFTELPTGVRHKAMSLAFQSVDRFACFSTMERSLYADYFSLDINRIDMIHWAVEPPQVSPVDEPVVAGDYVCAIGSQARDYSTLLAAAARLPSIRFVIVATLESMKGLPVPSNVDVRCGIPFPDAMNILARSRFTVVPLKGSRVPCGHVTIVAAMHLGKATIVTNSLGVADYLEPGVNGLTVEAGHVDEMVGCIEALWGEPELANRLGTSAREFAQRYCVEAVAVEYFQRYLNSPESVRA